MVWLCCFLGHCSFLEEREILLEIGCEANRRAEAFFGPVLYRLGFKNRLVTLGGID